MTAFITGANRGIGRATALRLADDGHDIHFTFRTNEDEAAAVVAEIEAKGRRATAHRLDMADTAAFAQVAAAVDALDVLVLNAGEGLTARFGEVTPEQFDGIYDVHVKGPFLLAQALLPALGDGASIVFLSTAMTRFAFEGQSVYSSAKGALEVITKHLAKELGPRGIRVNAIAPGGIATDFGGGFLKDEAFQAEVAGFTALGRIGEATDVADAIGALVQSPWVTAQRIEVSGGTQL